MITILNFLRFKSSVILYDDDIPVGALRESNRK